MTDLEAQQGIILQPLGAVSYHPLATPLRSEICSKKISTSEEAGYIRRKVNLVGR